MKSAMQYEFEILKSTRKNILSALENVNIKDLHKIPDGFTNHIAWNFNHIVIVQQLLCYKLSELPIDLDEELIKRYSKASVPTEKIYKEDFELCKRLMFKNIDALITDYENNRFKTYITYTTSYNITLKNIENAIQFNNVHEGLHLGYIMALKRAIGL